MNRELIESIRDLCKERGLDEELVFTAIEESLVAAYKREFNARNVDNVGASIDRDTGEMAVYLDKVVVEEVEDPNAEMPLSEAQALDPDFEVGDVLQYELEPSDFGRLAAQAAKSAINQSLITAERDKIHDEFSNRIGDLAYGVVQRADAHEVIVDIDRAEAVLTRYDQSPLDTYDFHDRMLFVIKRVDERRGRPIVYVTRASSDLVVKLFDKEVPEIQSDVVRIASVAREAGSRTKIAVYSTDENVDALGACVGQRGMRVQNVTDELRGEKIDIIEWDADDTVFIRNALKPANVLRVELVETEDSKEATVIVPNNQLSLAIGKRGQNARLAAKLTGWKIDIKDEDELREQIEASFMADFEAAAGYSADELADGEFEDLATDNLEGDVVETEEVTDPGTAELTMDQLADEILSASLDEEVEETTPDEENITVDEYEEAVADLEEEYNEELEAELEEAQELDITVEEDVDDLI